MRCYINNFCWLRNVCSALSIDFPVCELTIQIRVYIESISLYSHRLPQADGELYPSFDADKCGKYSAECPLRLLKLTPYTDLWIWILLIMKIICTIAKINKQKKKKTIWVYFVYGQLYFIRTKLNSRSFEFQLKSRISAQLNSQFGNKPQMFDFKFCKRNTSLKRKPTSQLIQHP